jgi:FMN phosphatase YigB (HAD superfamily)
MTNSNYLSDYDKETIRMFKEAKLLIIDLDGTLIDFEKIDNIIIEKLFPNSRIINSIDNILWKVNRLDVFGNGYAGLKLRLAVYSLFSKNSFKECKEKYAKWYEKLAKVELLSVFGTTLNDLISNGYDISIVTKNVYAKNLLKQNIFSLEADKKNKINIVVLKKAKKKKFKEMVEAYDGKVCVIGNNLSDDIINSYKIGSPYIYIGKSKIVNLVINITNKLFRKRGIQFRNIKKIKSIFTQ